MRQIVQQQARLIILGFVILLASMFGMSLDAGLSLYRIQDQLADALEHLADEQLLAQEMRTHTQMLRRYEKDVLLSVGNPDMAREYYQKWQETGRKAGRKMEEMRKLAQHPEHVPAYLTPPVVKEMQADLNTYQEAFQEVYQRLPKVTRPEEERKLWSELGHAKLSTYQLDEQLQAVVDRAEIAEQRALAASEKLRNHSLIRLGLICLGLLIIGTVLAVYVTRRTLAISRKLDFGARHDPLTHLLNRRGLELVLAGQLAQGGQLLYLDLDKFKLVNDICGHVVGDDLLVSMTKALQAQCAAPSVLARVGGDEFVIWMPGATAEEARLLGERLVDTVRQHPFSWQGREFILGASVGFAGTLEHISYRELLSRADAACLLSKRDRLGVVQSFEENAPQLQRLQQEQEWATQIPRLIQEGRLVLYGQRIMPLQPGDGEARPKIEILLRGRDEDEHLISPGLFIPAAERYGLMARIDRWVIEHTLAQASAANLSLSINLSAQTMTDPRFLMELETMIVRSGIAPDKLCFEITESAAMTNMEITKQYIQRLRALGCRFSLDDFGSGFSSFAYLKELHVDYLKIDGSLIRNMENNTEDTALVYAIVQMAKALGLQTVAEFVETPSLAGHLSRLGVIYGQGYGLHKPEPLQDLLQQTAAASE